jgi:signal transduction histidine kinase
MGETDVPPKTGPDDVARRPSGSVSKPAQKRTRKRVDPPRVEGKADTDDLVALARDLKTIEREKERLSHELHDGLGQHLTGIAFLAKALANRLGDRGAPETVDAQQIAALTNQAISNTRALARGLRPVGPEDNAFAVALSVLARDVSTIYGIQCAFNGDGAIAVASRMVAHHLFRIAQEAVHNAVKHGAGGRILVDLREENDEIILTIANRGTLAAAVEAAEGIGISSMRNRAKLLDARLDIKQVGKEVSVRVALDKNAAQSMREQGNAL